MKPISIAVCTLCIILISISCEEEETQNDNQDLLIGSWKLNTTIENGEPLKLSECDLQNTLTFTQTEVIYLIKFGKNCEESITDINDYELNGSTLTVTNGNTSFSSDILQLSNTALQLESSESGVTTVESYTRL